MKKFALAVGTILLVTGMAYTTAFAADTSSCKVCSSTSPLIDEYISFSQEILSTLQTIANEKQRANNQQSSTQDESTRVLERIANNLNEKGQTAITYSVLMGTIGKQLIGSTTRQELQVMTNAKALMRDWEKLDDLDQQISHTLFDLGQAGAFISNIQEYRQRVKAIYEKYANKDGAFITMTGEPPTSASTLIGALWDLNQAYKRFIATDHTDGFNVFSAKYKDSLGISLSAVNYGLTDEYACARGFNSCDTQYKEFGDNMASIASGAKDQAKEAINTVKTSLLRLKCAFAKQGNLKCEKAGFTDRQNDLLRGLYGIEGVRAAKAGTKALANSMTRLGDSLANEINDVKSFYTKNDNQSSPIVIPQRASMDVGAPDTASAVSSANLYSNLLGTVNSTMNQSKSTWQQHVLADPLVVTRNIPRVTLMVYSSVNIIGDAQTSKSITQNLGKACENQCSNLGGTCYY